MISALVEEFHDFFEKIQLNTTQGNRIKSAIKALSEYLSKEYEITEDGIFVQGSFSTDTVTKPPPSQKDGEYDVDLVVLCADSDQTPKQAIDNLESTLEENSVYKDKIEKDDPKIPCVRLRYADEDKARFHVDVVPARRIEGKVIEIPRKSEGWEISNPEEYTKWVLLLGERYQRTIMFLRRWRDENQVPIKSIVLQVLTAEQLSSEEDDAANLAGTIESLHNFISGFDSPPEIYNPVLEEENLTKRCSQEDFDTFKDELGQAVGVISSIKEQSEHDEACDKWQKILGEDFTYKTDKEFLASDVERGLGDFSHAKTLKYYSIPNRPDSGVRIELKATIRNEHKRTRFSSKFMRRIKLKSIFSTREPSSGEVVASGQEINFNVHVHGIGDRDFKIYWQVVNTGEEARGSDNLRGEIFPAKDSEGKRSHTESTKYYGTHWIEAYVISNGDCIARSGRFYVRIKHSNSNT